MKYLNFHVTDLSSKLDKIFFNSGINKQIREHLNSLRRHSLKPIYRNKQTE